MRVSAVDIERAFADLRDAGRTREQIAEWAKEMIGHDDAGELHFDPASAEPLLRKAVQYLAGVDLRDAPNSYLHIDADFDRFLKGWRAELAGR